MAKLFINYRSTDDPSAAALMRRVLSDAFGPDEVFLDNASIQPGNDFERELLRRVCGAEVMLVVVGPRWHTTELGNPDDWVRREIAVAFAAGVRVIPVLVGGAGLLTGAPLPFDIAELSRCQHIRLHQDNLDQDLASLVRTLTSLLPGRPSSSPPVGMRAHATDHARIYQAGGNQVINER